MTDRSDLRARTLDACRQLSERDVAAMFADVDPDFTWTMPFLPDRFAYAGCRDRAGMQALLAEFLGGFDTFVFTVEEIVVEGETVAVKGASAGAGPGSARYANTYHLFFTWRDGKLLAVRELFDPYQVEAYAAQVAAQAPA